MSGRQICGFRLVYVRCLYMGVWMSYGLVKVGVVEVWAAGALEGRRVWGKPILRTVEHSLF